MKKRFVVVSVLLVLFVSLLSAQTTTSLNGIVSDPTGAVIPNATITLVNDDTTAQRETRSDSEGRYSFAQVQPGRYHLLAKASGFNDVNIAELRLLVNTPAKVPIVLAKLGT